MKITKLHIDQFRHLENLDFDFTYQSGERKGQPLDKICFIGQSASGKTGLLELFFDYINYTFNCELINKRLTGARYNIKKLDGILEFSLDNKNKNSIKLKDDTISIDNKLYSRDEHGGGGKVDKLIPLNEIELLYYFKANILSEKI